MPVLHSRIIRLASELPQGDPTRRKLLAALKESEDLAMSLAIPLLGPTPYDDKDWESTVKRFVGSGFKVWSGTGVGDQWVVHVSPLRSMGKDEWLQWVADNMNPLVKALSRWKPDTGMLYQYNSYMTRALNKALRDGRVTR